MSIDTSSKQILKQQINLLQLKLVQEKLLKLVNFV